MRCTILACLLALATSCSAPPPTAAPRPLAAPDGLATAGDALPGRTLAAGSAANAVADAAAAPGPRRFVKIVLALLAERPAEGGARLVDALAVVADPAASGSLRLPSAALEPGQTWRGAAARDLLDRLRGAGATAFLPLAEFDEPLIGGFTSWFAASVRERLDDRSDFLRERTPPEPLERRFALAVDTGGSDGATVTLERGSPGFDGELAKLSTPLQAADGPLLIVVPSPFVGGHGAWCAAWLEVEEVAAESPAAARWRARAEELVAREQARRAATQAPALQVSERLAAWRDLRREANSRTALVWLTTRLPESCAADLAVATDDLQLAGLLVHCIELRAVAPEPADDAALDALLERAALGWLAQEATNGELPAELSSVLARRTGALAAYPSQLAELARNCTSLERLAQQLVEENLELLEESSAASRVRAYDWLARRGAAPDGFDPLAPLAQRRAVLAARAAAASDAATDAATDAERADG